MATALGIGYAYMSRRDELDSFWRYETQTKA